MTGLPRVSGREAARAFASVGYEIVRQRGSHLRLRHPTNARAPLTVPDHDELKTGLLRTNELASFRDQLGMLHDALNGSATFETMEHWLRVDIQGDGRGHFLAKCEARDRPGIGNTLRFELAFDQTELPLVLTALNEVVRACPVTGSP